MKCVWLYSDYVNRANTTLNIRKRLPHLSCLAVPGVCIYNVRFNNYQMLLQLKQITSLFFTSSV